MTDEEGFDLQFCVLGEVAVVRDGLVVPLSRTQRAVLAVLLDEANQPVRTARITAAVWPDQSRQPTNLQTVIGALRAAFTPTSGDPHRHLSTTSSGYQLTVPPERYDRERFRAAVRRGDAHRADRRASAAADAYRDALVQWAGAHPYAGLPELRHFDGPIDALVEERLQVRKRLIDAELACGRHVEVVAELRALTADLPLREDFWRQLLIALYRSGRAAEVDETYLRMAQALRDIDAVPGETSARLWADISAGRQVGDRYQLGAPLDLNATVGEPGSDPRARFVRPDGTLIEVTTGSFRIGRSAGNDLVLDHDLVSRQHASLIATPTGWFVVDRQSRNGTYVDGARVVGEMPLAPSTLLRIGPFELRFETDVRL